MTPDQAEFLLKEVYIPQIENERKTTRRVIEAVPVDKSDYKPDPTSKSALQLAWHLAQSECFFLSAVASGRFEVPGPMPDSIKTSADVLKWYDENASKATAALSGLKGAALTTPIDFRGVFNFPAIVYLGLANNHAIHHRDSLRRTFGPWARRCRGFMAAARTNRCSFRR